MKGSDKRRDFVSQGKGKRGEIEGREKKGESEKKVRG